MSGTAADRSITSVVEVSVDPHTAFRVFTEELDLWWVRGPINHFAAGRVREIRCEPGVGGRLLEVYDDTTGDALELARITTWDPGRLLAFRSSVDDVRTEVHFDAASDGTTVRVVATIPAGTQDKGGTAWVRTVPKWFGPWCDARDHRPHEVQDLARLALGVYYARPAAAARWLADTLGLQSPDPLPEGDDPLPETEYGHPWIEFRVGNVSLMVCRLDGHGPQPATTHQPWIYVDDIDAHHRHATERGATVVEELASPWGLPYYVLADPEGYRWTVAEARPTMT